MDSKFVTKVKEQYQKSKIEAIWENRFHNAVIDWETETAENQTNGWMFFISRPGMELTRKLDEKGQDIFAFYKREIENFLKEKGSAKNWMADRDADKLFTQTIVDRRSASGAFITFIWPFSLSDEAPRKTGVMFHLGHHPEVEDAPPRPFTPECGKRPFSMYDTELQKSFTTTFPNPPGVKSNQNDEAGQDLQWSNFASSKIFPTNALLNENNWGRFRNLMSLQFIEVRLLNPLDHIGDVLGEQVEALQKFQRHNSGFSSFSGAPGTGKSTLLHMVCADRIAKNWAAGADHRIMYYVPSVALKTEATREVHAILQYVYALEHELCNTLVTNYFFPVTQEDLYLENLPPSSFNLISPASDKKISELIPEFKHLSFPLDDKDALRGQKITQFKEHLRRLIYGVFEDFSKFQAWHAHARSVYANAWSDMTINLYSIDRKQSSQMSDASFPPNRFIHAKMKDEFLKYATNPKVITHINGDGNNTQFWDPTTMVVGAYNLGVNDEQLWKGTVWSDLKGKADYIVIDEVQDITLTEARILLKHFSNRQQTNQLRPFRFIIAGDAYQNIKQLIFVPDNKHIHSLFEDWRSHLSVQFVDTALGGERLSKGLEKTSTCVLRASYRTHDEMLPSIAQIMTNIRNIDSEEYKKGVDATAKPTPFGRDGLLLIAKSKGKELTEEQKKQQLLWMEDILRALRYQFDVDPNTKDMTWNPEAANKEIQVSYCYDEIDADWKVLSDQEANTDLHPLSEVLSGKNTVWHKTLDELLMNFTKLFRRTILKNIDDDQHYDPRQLWQTEAEARGVFTIQQIKGLTLPITITQPPKQFSKGLQSKSRKGTAKGFKRSDWSKLLVELTRAQYVNVLMENHNALPNLDSHFVSNIRDPTSITQLLFNVARFSTGYIMPLEQAYFIALNNHENAQTWVRLRELVDSHPDPKMGFFAEWPRNMLLALYKKSTDGLPYDSLQSIGVEFQKNGDPQFRYGNQRLKLDEIHAFEENNLLGDRFSQKTFASLLIFLQCNHLMREKIQGEDNTFDVDGLVKSIQLWLLAHKQHGSKEEWEPSWFNFILDPDASQDEDSETSIKKGKIDGLIEKTFSNPLEPIKIILPSSGNEPMEVTNPSAFQNHEEELKTNRPQTNQNNNEVSIEWKWPTISFPRLNMGSWHLRNKRIEPLEDEIAQAWDESAWMREGQSYYTMPMQVMRRLIEEVSVGKQGSIGWLESKQKLLMLIAMTELDDELFWNSMKVHLENLDNDGKIESAKDFLDWFVKLLKKFKPNDEDEAEWEKSQFLENVRQRLETYLQENLESTNAVRQSVSNLIGNATNREELLMRLEALAFEKWSSTVSVLNSLQNSVILSSKAILEHNQYLGTFLERQELLAKLLKTIERRKNEETADPRDKLGEEIEELEKQLKLIEAELKKEAALYGIRQSVSSRPPEVENDYVEGRAFWNFFHANDQLKEANLVDLFSSLAHVPKLTGGDGFDSIHKNRLKIPSFRDTRLSQALVVCLNYWSQLEGDEEASEKFTEFVVNAIQKPESDGQLKSLLEFILSCNRFVKLTREIQDKAFRETPYFNEHFYHHFRSSSQFPRAMASLLFKETNPSLVNEWSTIENLLLSNQAKIIYALLGDSINDLDDYSVQNWKELSMTTKTSSQPVEKSEYPIRIETVFKPLEHYAHIPITGPAPHDDPANMTYLHSVPMFQGFAYMADLSPGDDADAKDYQNAIEAFTLSGHHHYVAVLRLLKGYKAFDEARMKENAAWELLDIMIDLLRLGRERLISNLYLGVEFTNQHEKIRASNYGMNFIPSKSEPRNFRNSEEWKQSIFSKFSFLDVDKLVKVSKKDKKEKNRTLNPNMEVGFMGAQNTQPKRKTFKVESFSGMKDWEVVRNRKSNEIIQYLTFHHTMQNMERLSEALEHGRKKARTPLEALNGIDATSYTTLKKNMGAYQWKYEPKKGFVPKTSCIQQDDNVIKILEFCRNIIDIEHPLSFTQFKMALSEFTNIEGMMKEWLVPSSAGDDIDTNLDACLNTIRNSTASLPEEERDKYRQGINEIYEWVERGSYLNSEEKNLQRLNNYISDYELPERVAMAIRTAWKEFRRDEA